MKSVEYGMCDFTSFSTVFQSYQDDGQMITNCCMVHLSCKPITKTGLVGGLYTDRSTIQLEGLVGGLYTCISTI